MYDHKRLSKGIVFYRFVCKSYLYSLFLLQEADLLLSMVAARLRVGNGTSGNENQNQAKLSRKDLSEVQNLLMEHLITGY